MAFTELRADRTSYLPVLGRTGLYITERRTDGPFQVVKSRKNLKELSTGRLTSTFYTFFLYLHSTVNKLLCSIDIQHLER